MRCAAAFFAWRWFYTLWDGAAWQIRPVFTKKDCFWQNREFSMNKLGLLTIYNREHHGYTYVRLISCLYI